MLDYLLPVGLCLLTWWLGTGAVLLLNRMPEDTYRRNLVVFTFVAVLAIAGVFYSKNTVTVGSACVAFVAVIVIWGWLEFMHYSGYLVGPRTQVCPARVSTWRRFFCAVHAMLYHELALAITGVLLVLMTWGSLNKTALYTYLVLWVMRVSAELNIFFGVAYLPEEWLPQKLQYLMSYRKRQGFSAFFPVSIGTAVLYCTWMFVQMPSAGNDAFTHTSTVLVGTLLVLAIIEHGLLVMPIKGTALWTWAQGRAA